MPEHESYVVAMGMAPEMDLCGHGRITVDRYGRRRPEYRLMCDGELLATLLWCGPRRLRYTVFRSEDSMDLIVGPRKRRIHAIERNGRTSRIIINSNKNLARHDISLQTYDGANFFVLRQCADRWGTVRFEVHKQFYPHNLLVFRYDERDAAAPIQIDVERLMRWEIKHFHRMIALVLSRIVLEYGMRGLR